MDPDVVPGTGYYDVLVEVKEALDFLMPQYYNGFIRLVDDGFGPGSPGLEHFDHIRNDIFDGDATKIVVGFCLFDCSGTGTNTNAEEAIVVMSQLAETYPCNGGVFFWESTHDVGGEWSSTVGEAIFQNSGCSVPVYNDLFSASTPVSSYEAIFNFQPIVNIISWTRNNRVLAIIAEGGAAGSNNVISEGQGYALLSIGITLAAMDPSDPNRNLLLTIFHGFFNGWKQMCQNSSPLSFCQEHKLCNG